MAGLSIALTTLCGLVSLVWLSRHVMIVREKRKGFTLTADYAGPPADAPFLSVVVAAKDEEANIETCLRTMLTQDYPRFEIVVCNDRSTDNTAAIVERVAKEDPRVRLVNITDLPAGWCGKNNAMQTGIATLTSEWFCMIDADCRQLSPRTLSTAMQYAQDHRTDLLSVLPVLEMKSAWENIVQPVCGGVMMIWFHPDKVNSPDHPHAYANGAFMLMKRSAYRAVGTHEAVKDRVNEDMHLAALTKAQGLRLRVVRSEGLYVVRMYTSLSQIVRGWSRIFFGTFGTLRRLTVSLLLMVVMGLLPYLAAGAGVGVALAGAKPNAWPWIAAGAGFVAVMLQVSVIYRFYKLVSAKPALAWTYPIGCLVTIYALIQSMLKHRKGAKVTWRSTSYAKPA